MKTKRLIKYAVMSLVAVSSVSCKTKDTDLEFVGIDNVVVNDPFWSPLLDRTAHVTLTDVLDKFEGTKTFDNFDRIAEGHVADGGHNGLPWFDGLIYESISGISDYLIHYPDKQLEARIDGYIDRIAEAQEADPDGYLNTYTALMENDHRWGENGGNLRWQHDVYNSGCLVEAGVHYYLATGKTKLLEVATKLANYMYDYMAGPKHNVVPGHALPEDALVQLYELYNAKPELKKQVSVPVDENHYLALAEFWIDQRGHTEGRRPLEAYAQDDIPLTEKCTIEGHAVRATLHANGVASVAINTKDQGYIDAATRLWENMTGKRMFITGGVGAIHEDEKFGPDYYLPVDAYLETCAAIGAGFFSLHMNQLTGEARYMDVLERILFNSIPVAIGLDGTSYTYQNPLNADKQNRWPWHGCPCCPPMFLKMTGALPGMIWSWKSSDGVDDVYVNLPIGSTASMNLPNAGDVRLEQTVDWTTGKISISAEAKKSKKLRVHVRIPSWNRGEELPLALYTNDLVSDNPYSYDEKGYAVFESNDIEIQLNMSPRFVEATPEVTMLNGAKCLASGPFIYALEKLDNEAVWDEITYEGNEFSLDETTVNGVRNIVSNDDSLHAVPYYYILNRVPDSSYRVWVGFSVK